jgi:hypothetical protein
MARRTGLRYPLYQVGADELLDAFNAVHFETHIQHESECRLAIQLHWMGPYLHDGCRQFRNPLLEDLSAMSPPLALSLDRKEIHPRGIIHEWA